MDKAGTTPKRYFQCAGSSGQFTILAAFVFFAWRAIAIGVAGSHTNVFTVAPFFAGLNFSSVSIWRFWTRWLESSKLVSNECLGSRYIQTFLIEQ